jgi:hypothetical protein
VKSLFKVTWIEVICASGNAIDQHHSLFAVDFLETHFHDFRVAGLNASANE